jgi:hypothetical protein
VLAFSTVEAQQAYQMTPKEAEKHAKAIERSKKSGDIIWDYDTVFVAGVPNCIVYKVDKGALQHDDYSIRSLTGQELIYVRYGTALDYNAAHAPNTPPPTIGYYSYIFSDTKNTGETYSSIRPFKTTGRYNLIMNGNAINPNGEANFIAENPVRWSVPPPPPPVVQVVVAPVNNYPPPQQINTNIQTSPPENNNVAQQSQQVTAYNAQQSQPVNNNVAQQSQQQVTTYTAPQTQPVNTYVAPTSQPTNTYAGPNSFVLVPRDQNGEIRVDDNNIYQAGQVIGTIQYNEVNVNGMFTKTLAVFLPNGTKVAQAYTIPNADVHAWNIVTFKDKARNTVNSHEGHDKEEVLWYLVKGSYL